MGLNVEYDVHIVQRPEEDDGCFQRGDADRGVQSRGRLLAGSVRGEGEVEGEGVKTLNREYSHKDVFFSR